MAMNISKHRRSLGPALLRLAGGILCLVWLQWLAAGDMLAAQDDENFFTHLHTEKAMANVTVSPGRAGPVEIAIQLETTDELPLVAQAVSITLTDMQTGKKLEKAQAMRTAEDQWQVKSSDAVRRTVDAWSGHFDFRCGQDQRGSAYLDFRGRGRRSQASSTLGY